MGKGDPFTAKWAVYLLTSLSLTIISLCLWHLLNLGFFSANREDVKVTAAEVVAYNDVVVKTLLPMFQCAAGALITFIVGAAGIRMVRTFKDE